MSSWAPWPCMRIVPHSISVGPAAAAGALDGGAGRLEHRLDVVAVDLDAGEPVGRGALDRVDRELELVRGRVGELVVLEHEDDRQLVDAGEVHRLVPLAVGGRALAEVGHRDPRLAAQLERHAPSRWRPAPCRAASRPCRRSRARGRRSACCRPCRRSAPPERPM